MVEDYASIMKNDVLDIVSRLKEKMVVSSKWIFKINNVVVGNKDKFKVRFVVRGFS
jgi:hypothetical protein